MQLLKNKEDKSIDEQKNCGICDLPINSNQNFCVLDNYNSGEFTSRAYYHAKCFRDKFLKSNQLNKNLKKTHDLLDGVKEKFLG